MSSQSAFAVCICGKGVPVLVGSGASISNNPQCSCPDNTGTYLVVNNECMPICAVGAPVTADCVPGTTTESLSGTTWGNPKIEEVQKAVDVSAQTPSAGALTNTVVNDSLA